MNRKVDYFELQANLFAHGMMQMGPLLLQVEAKMGFEGEDALEVSDMEPPVGSAAGSAADLSFLNQPFDDAEGDWSFS